MGNYGYTSKMGKTQMRSDKRNCVSFTFKFTISTDSDIIEKLQSLDNKQGYIKSLIRSDIQGEA